MLGRARAEFGLGRFTEARATLDDLRARWPSWESADGHLLYARTLEGDDRIIGMFGMEIRERLLSRDDATRTISYSVVDGVPIDSHQATITVEPDGGGSKVTWAYAVTPDEMAPIFGDTYKAALASLENAFS